MQGHAPRQDVGDCEHLIVCEPVTEWSVESDDVGLVNRCTHANGERCPVDYHCSTGEIVDISSKVITIHFLFSFYFTMHWVLCPVRDFKLLTFEYAT